MQNTRKKVLVSFILLMLLWGETEGQWLTGYTHRNTIEVIASAVSGSQTLEDFPLLIHMSGPELRAVTYGGEVMNPLGRDMRFTLADGTLLDFDMEFYAPATGNLAVWVRIPRFTPTENFVLYIYYGNSSVNAFPPAENVWTSEYRGVWHMSDNTLDATQYKNDGTDKGTSSKDGKIGLSRGYDGIEDMVYVPYSRSIGMQENLSIETWLRYTSIEDLYNGLITKRGDYELWYAKGHLMFMVAGGSIEYPIELEEDAWYHICVTYDRSVLRLFLNGTEVSSQANTTQISNDILAGLGLGFCDTQENSELSGDLDEVRISSRTLSEDWIRTTFSNQDDPSAFSSYLNTQISNDFPCSATLINVNDDCASNVYSNLSSTNSGIPLTPSMLYNEADTWFKVEVPAKGNLLIKLESGATPEIPTQGDWLNQPGLAVYQGSCNNLSYDTCWIDPIPGAPFQMPEILLTDYTPGDTLFLRVWGDKNSVGKFRICAVANDVAPGIICPEDMNSPTDPDSCSATLSIAAPTVSSGNGILTLINDYNGSSDASDTYAAGITQIEWTVTDTLGMQATCYHVLTVYDTLAPEISCPVDQAVYVNAQCEIVIPDYRDSVSVIDNCDSDLLVTQSPEPGSIVGGTDSLLSVEIIVQDKRENTAQCQFNLQIYDTLGPVMNCPQDISEYLDNIGEFSLPDYGSTLGFMDNCDPLPTYTQIPPAGTKLSGSGSMHDILLIAMDNKDNLSGCGFTLTLLENTEPANGLIIPEAFSPNEDGLNDRFEIPGIERYTSTELRVFNAYGMVVFQRLNYDNSWDGRSSAIFNEGEELPTGTYFYVLHLEEEATIIKGFVYLKRE